MTGAKPASAACKERIEWATQRGGEALDLSGLGLKALDPFPPELGGLRELDLSSNRLSEVPAFVWNCPSLERLDLGNNRLATLPGEVGRLAALVCLDASENRLSALPQELGRCANLQELHLYSNNLASLFGIPTRFQRLRRLDLSRNQLRLPPKAEMPFPNVVELDLSNNLLDNLPNALAQLRQLFVLNLSGNHLRSADLLAGMSWLRELYLDNNALRDLPGEIEHWPSLRVLSAAGNPFGDLPRQFDRVSATEVRNKAKTAIEAHVSGGGQADKLYVVAPSFFLDFLFAIGGVTSVLRMIDYWYKRPAPVCNATIQFPDGSTIELSNLSRKAALRLVQQHSASLETGNVLLEVGVARGPDDLRRKSDFLADLVTRTGLTELIPKAAAQPVIQLNNFNVVDNSQRREYKMGDEIHIGSITGSNVNFKSKLQNVKQNISSAAGDASVKEKLSQLIQQLTAALDRAPQEKKDDAEAIAEAATDLVGKATREQPNKKSIAISATGLVDAAKAIAEVVPIATSIVSTVTKFVGSL